MTDGQLQTLMNKFIWYVRAWERTSDEYDATPSWRMIKQFKLLRRMEKLTDDYQKEMNKWGL